MGYEEHLSALIRRGRAVLPLIALAERAGWKNCLAAWIEAAKRDHKDFDERRTRPLFDAFVFGDVSAIEAAARADLRTLPNKPTKDFDQWEAGGIDNCLADFVDILVSLDRIDVLLELHKRCVERCGRPKWSTMAAVRLLGRIGDWENALVVLEEARRLKADMAIDKRDIAQLLRWAYFHHAVETVCRALAQFRGADEYELERVTYQLLAGLNGVQVPLITGEQPNGYTDALATEIAVLEDDPSATSRVRQLHAIATPKTPRMEFPQRGVEVLLAEFPNALARARARIAARRKDYAKATAIAREPRKDSLIDNPTRVVDAFLEAGDWRGAAMISMEYDDRDMPLIDGFDDDRLTRYVELQRALAALAARDGDDGAASIFLYDAKAADDPEPDRQEAIEFAESIGCSDERRAELEADAVEGRFLKLETVLAGVAEGFLPRKLVTMLVPVARSTGDLP